MSIFSSGKYSTLKPSARRMTIPDGSWVKCKKCGQFFTFPSTLPHYPNYCGNCRKQHQAAMKEKYGRPVQRAKGK